jgi:hypothetical protein
MKRLLNLLIPSYSCQSIEVVTIHGQERCLVHDVYTWLGFSFVGETILYESLSDAMAQIQRS